VGPHDQRLIKSKQTLDRDQLATMLEIEISWMVDSQGAAIDAAAGGGVSIGWAGPLDRK
jgi:hypothetical protein